MENFSDKVSFLWSAADLLRGPYRPNQYGRVMLPLTVLRRLDCVLEPTKEAVLARAAKLKGGKLENTEPVLNRVAGVRFHNTSELTFSKLKDDPAHVARNLSGYIAGFSSNVRSLFEKFKFEDELIKLDEADRIYLIVKKFTEIDLLNERFGTEFTAADQLLFDQVREDAAANESIQQAAQANSIDNFGFVMRKLIEGLFIDRMDQNEEIVARYMNDEDIKRIVDDHIIRQVYDGVRGGRPV